VAPRPLDGDEHVATPGERELEEGGTEELVGRGLRGDGVTEGRPGPAREGDLYRDVGIGDRLAGGGVEEEDADVDRTGHDGGGIGEDGDVVGAESFPLA
jgi:hypothetical protein